MKTIFKPLCLAACVLLASNVVWAKLPVTAPTEESKAAAADAAVKKAAAGKMDAYKVCTAQMTAVAAYFKNAKAMGKTVNPPTATPACVKPS
jgi:hypothetical protein